MDSKSMRGCSRKIPQECSRCPLNAQLKCRFSKKDLFNFISRAFLFIVPASIGLAEGKAYWALLVWMVFMLFFFTIWEIRILCSHCPYYAEEGKVLHCIANYGSPKLWKYHPEPMNWSEKIQLFIGFGLFGLFPLIILTLFRRWFWGITALMGLLIFFNYLSTRVCTACVNFSCPLNRVAKPIVEAYLRRNPVMHNAWDSTKPHNPQDGP